MAEVVFGIIGAAVATIVILVTGLATDRGLFARRGPRPRGGRRRG